MLNAANWTVRLHELASRAHVPGAALGIWCDGQEILAAHGVLNSATKVPVTTDSLFQIGSSWSCTRPNPSTPPAPGSCCARDDQPWVPLSFGQLGDGTPYIYLSGRVTPQVG
jgi:hypothetical protein